MIVKHWLKTIEWSYCFQLNKLFITRVVFVVGICYGQMLALGNRVRHYFFLLIVLFLKNPIRLVFSNNKSDCCLLRLFGKRKQTMSLALEPPKSRLLGF